MRNIWQLPYRTHTCLLPHIVHDLCMKDQMIYRFVNYFASLLNTDNYVMNYFCLLASYCVNSSLGRNCAYVSRLFRMNVLNLNHLCCKYIHDKLWHNCLMSQNDILTGNFIRELCFLRDHPLTSPLPRQDAIDILEMLCLS